MHTLYISGSPRRDGNTDFLLNITCEKTGGEFIRLSDHHIEPCTACWACRKSKQCTVDDDMTDILIPRLLASDAIVLGTPVFFNNVSAQLKAFIDRTWCIRGLLRNKIGGAIVVGRRYGAEAAIAAITAAERLGERLLELGALLGYQRSER